MIIDSTYFKNSIYIPHAEPSMSDSVTSVDNDLTSKINEYSRECLIKCLGYSLFNSFSSNLDKSKPNGLKDTAEAKWDTLLNGEVYVNPKGETVEWRGIRWENVKDGGYTHSFLAYYVYYFYEQDDYITRSSIGHQKDEAKNAERVTPTHKVVNAWRRFFKIVQGDTELKSIVYYKDYGYGIDFYTGDGEITLYQYIIDKNNLIADTYPGFKPKLWLNKNQYGI